MKAIPVPAYNYDLKYQ